MMLQQYLQQRQQQLQQQLKRKAEMQKEYQTTQQQIKQLEEHLITIATIYNEINEESIRQELATIEDLQKSTVKKEK